MPKNTVVVKPSGHPTVAELIKRNKEYAEQMHITPPKLPELMAGLDNTPSVFIFTCMDSRCNPDQFFQTTSPGEYVTLRNVGGRVGGNISDLVSLDSLFKFTTVLVINHTDCGVTYVSEDVIRIHLGSSSSPADVNSLRLPNYTDTEIEQAVKYDVQLLRSSPFLRKELKANVQGLTYNFETGLLTLVS